MTRCVPSTATTASLIWSSTRDWKRTQPLFRGLALPGLPPGPRSVTLRHANMPPHALPRLSLLRPLGGGVARAFVAGL